MKIWCCSKGFERDERACGIVKWTRSNLPRPETVRSHVDICDDAMKLNRRHDAERGPGSPPAKIISAVQGELKGKKGGGFFDSMDPCLGGVLDVLSSLAVDRDAFSWTWTFH